MPFTAVNHNREENHFHWVLSPSNELLNLKVVLGTPNLQFVLEQVRSWGPEPCSWPLKEKQASGFPRLTQVKHFRCQLTGNDSSLGKATVSHSDAFLWNTLLSCELWKTSTHHRELHSFPILKILFGEAADDFNKCDLFNKMCQYLKNPQNLVNQYFQMASMWLQVKRFTPRIRQIHEF